MFRFSKNMTTTLFSLAGMVPATYFLFENSFNDNNVVNDEKKRDIFFLSHSLLFSLNETSIVHNKKNPPYVVVAPFWLDKTHSDYEDESWGQTLVGCPGAFRHRFMQAYPHFPADKYLSWKQIKKTRELQIEHLKSLHKKGVIILLDYRHEDISTYESGKLFKIIKKDNNISFFTKNADSPIFSEPVEKIDLVFNYLSLPRQLPEIVTASGFRTRPQTDLYYRSRNEAPSRLLVHGSGLSVVWLAKHFPDSLVCSVQKDNKQLPKISSNDDVDYSKIKIVALNDLSIDEKQPDTIYANMGENFGFLPFKLSSQVFTSIGYVPYTSLTSCFPFEKVKSYVDFDTNIHPWIAPKNIPIGSLTHRLLSFFHQAEMYDVISEAPYELQYYISETTPLIIQKKLHEKGISVSQSFFDILRDRIIGLDNPLANKSKEIEFYCDIFRISNGVSPSDTEINIFKSFIAELQNNIQERYQKSSEPSLENNIGSSSDFFMKKSSAINSGSSSKDDKPRPFG